MVSWLTGALTLMVRSRSSLCLAPTARVRCRKRLPSLIGFCVYILEAAAQNRQRLLKLRGEPANGLPPLMRSSSILILPMHPLRGAEMIWRALGAFAWTFAWVLALGCAVWAFGA